MSLNGHDPQAALSRTDSSPAVGIDWLNHLSACLLYPQGSGIDFVQTKYDITPKQNASCRDLSRSSPFLKTRHDNEVRHNLYSGTRCESSMSGTTCTPVVTELPPVDKSFGNGEMPGGPRQIVRRMTQSVEAATQTSDQSSKWKYTKKQRAEVQRYRQQVSLKEMEFSNSLSSLQTKSNLLLQQHSQSRIKLVDLVDLVGLVAHQAAELEALTSLRNTLKQQEQILEERQRREHGLSYGEESFAYNRPSSTISESHQTQSSNLSPTSGIEGLVSTFPLAHDDSAELDLPPTIVLDNFGKSSTARTPQSSEPLRFERNSGSYVSYYSNLLSSPHIDPDNIFNVVDSDTTDQFGIHNCVRFAGSQFSSNEGEIERAAQLYDDVREDDIFVCKKRERDLAHVLEVSPFTGSYQSTNLENFIDSKIASHSLGHMISYWILQLFLCSWLEFSRFILFASTEPDFQDIVLSLGYIHLTSLIYANWFSDGTLVEYRAVLSFHPSISSGSDDIPHYFQQIYISDSDHGHRRLEHFQLFNGTRSPGLRQASRIAQADQSDRSGNSESPSSSRLWSPRPERNVGTFDTEYEGLDIQQLPARPFVPFGRSRSFSDDEEQYNEEQSQKSCSEDY